MIILVIAEAIFIVQDVQEIPNVVGVMKEIHVKNHQQQLVLNQLKLVQIVMLLKIVNNVTDNGDVIGVFKIEQDLAKLAAHV